MDSERTETVAGGAETGLVSVILPCRDEAAVLAETLQSFLAAQESIHEIVFIDDGSRDNSLEIAKRLLGDCGKAVFIRHETAIGTAASLREGLSRVSGRFVFMGAGDDPIDPDLLPTALHWLGDHPGAGVFSAESRGIDLAGRPQDVPALPRPVDGAGFLDSRNCRAALYRMDSWFAGNTCVYRTDVLQDIGIHDDLGPFCDAYAAWTAALRHGACFVASPLGTKRDLVGGAGVAMFRDPARAEMIWLAARRRMEADPASAYPKALIDRMERRWRYNIARARLASRFDKTGGYTGSLAFAVFRFAVAVRYKPFDVLSILLRRGGRPVSGTLPRDEPDGGK